VSAIAVAAETGTVTITGGTLSVTADDVALSGVTVRRQSFRTDLNGDFLPS